MIFARKFIRGLFKDFGLNTLSNLIFGIIIVLLGFLFIFVGGHFWHPLVIAGSLFIIIGLFMAALIT